MTNKRREEHLNDPNHPYRYGSYVGSSSAVHVGIEKVHYVRYGKKLLLSVAELERRCGNAWKTKERRRNREYITPRLR